MEDEQHLLDIKAGTTPKYSFKDPSPAFHYARAAPAGTSLVASTLGAPPKAPAPPPSASPSGSEGAPAPATPTSTGNRKYGEQPDAHEELDREISDFFTKRITNKVYAKAVAKRAGYSGRELIRVLQHKFNTHKDLAHDDTSARMKALEDEGLAAPTVAAYNAYTTEYCSLNERRLKPYEQRLGLNVNTLKQVLLQMRCGNTWLK